jgi:hypothetical protein
MKPNGIIYVNRVNKPVIVSSRDGTSDQLAADTQLSNWNDIMNLRRKILNPFLLMGLLAVIGIVAGLGLTGAFDSGETDPAPIRASSSSPASTDNEIAETPNPDDTPTTESSGPGATPSPETNGTEAPSKTIFFTSIIDPDPNFEEELRSSRISANGWKTDFSRHTVPFNELFSGGPPRDGIPPIDNPKFTTFKNPDRWLDPLEPVIAFELNGDSRAYPLQILIWHEIVNDVVGGVPVAVTFCPLCNSSIVFERTLDGVVHDFGTSGKLRRSDLVMWDRQTETWWQQLTGEGIIGTLAGKKLNFLPASVISWSDFKTANPEGKVLSRHTGFVRDYGENSYEGYDRADNPPFLFDGDLDGRLLPKERVATIVIDNTAAAFPSTILDGERVVNYEISGKKIVVFFKPGTRSALDGLLIGDSQEIGSTGVFEAVLDGQALTFRSEGGTFVDNETGSVWNIVGKATEGPLAGKTLTPIVHDNTFWFAWGSFRPDTNIYQGLG